MIEDSPSYCAMTFWPCLSQGEWVSVWSGVIGAAAAFLLSIAYQKLLRDRERKVARHSVGRAITDLRQAFAVQSAAFDPKLASKAVVRARAAFSWATEHPEHFSFAEWSSLHEMSELIEIWFEDNSRLGGFRNSIYTEEGPGNLLWALGQRFDRFTDFTL